VGQPTPDTDVTRRSLNPALLDQPATLASRGRRPKIKKLWNDQPDAPCAVLSVSASRRDRASWSVPRGSQVAFAQDGLDHPAQAAHRATAPVASDRGMFGAVERRHPAFVETAFSGKVRNHGRQEEVAMFRAGLPEGDDTKPIAYGARERVQRVGRRHEGNMRQIESFLQRRIRVARTCLGLEEAEKAIPESPIVRPAGGLLDLVDEDQRVRDLALGDGEKGMTGLGRVPTPVSTTEHGAIGARRVRTPDVQAKDFSEAASKSCFAAAGLTDQQQRP
jgi:hypothetical protein